jgi:PAS domain S-box-containing protein
MVHDQDREAVTTQAARVMTGEMPPPLEHRLIHRDGSVRWVRNTPVPRYDERRRLVAYDGSIADITARKRAEATLRESEARYKKLLGSVTDYVYTVQVEEGRPVRTVHGPGCAAVTGYTPEEYQADPDLWYRMVHDQDREAVTTQAARVMTGETLPPLEHRLIHRDGSVRWVRNTPVPRYDERHRLVAYDGLIADITARKQGEEARLELERRLLHAQKLESLGVLAGGIAHDFNNLLMAILGNLDLARLVLSPVSAARLSVEEAVHAAQRAAELTRQMLAYAGKGRFIVTDLDLSALVAENAHAFRAALPKTVTLHLQLGQGLPPIHADAGQLQQVITNLFTNAAEALGDQAGVVALATGVQDCDAAALAGGRVATLPAPGRFVWLAVTDTGCGMDAATQQRLFEPFFTTKFTGRGLGLSAVLGIVQGHHGTLFVESEPGRGTTLRVLFPVSDAPPAPPAEGAAAAASQALAPEGQPPSSSGTILVVDDEPMVRTTLQAMVEHCGFRVLLAADGEEAVAIFRAHAAEIVGVLLDLSMPRMDGAATLAALRQIQPEVKVILCSGYDESEATQRFTGQGLAGFLQKPYTLGKLKALLAGLMPARGEGA